MTDDTGVPGAGPAPAAAERATAAQTLPGTTLPGTTTVRPPARAAAGPSPAAAGEESPHPAGTVPGAQATTGIVFALVAAATFSLSGPFARGLLDAGWTAGAAVTARVLIGGAVLALPAALALRGRWSSLRDQVWSLVAYGMVAVAGTQLTFFYAVSSLDVGVALLIEFMAPVAVVGWMWARHGRRPGALTCIGGVVALGGLVLVLDLAGGEGISVPGVLWALGAMVGAAGYFLMSARPTGLPPVALASGGLLAGGMSLLVAGLVGIVPLRVADQVVRFQGFTLPWWVPVLGLGVVTAAVAYTTGIAASRRLGARLASFVGLTEVMFAVLAAWLLLGQEPAPVQLAGGVLILVGIVTVRAGESR
ncbi:EamA family transporter [Myceligenerans indicum]|uniref:DMT family transporter n=1 Tax=Myceligenerans indicum TaxID=2593663 RepID=A0ABS1LLH4_9MICO|nr:DMT family transporter [Myceligenerans indicum]MBL0886984.1 DMT family transporter [Myceligenerans indicum]